MPIPRLILRSYIREDFMSHENIVTIIPTRNSTLQRRINFEKTFLSLLANNLEMSLYEILHKLMDLKSLTFVGFSFWDKGDMGLIQLFEEMIMM